MFNQSHKDITIPGAEISPLEYGLKAQHRGGLVIMDNFDLFNQPEQEVEVWKQAPGFEGLYEVSSLGRIKTLKRISRSPISKILYEKILAGGDCKGYPCVILHDGNYKKKFTKHRLVALTFIPNPLNFPQINHKNGIKTDNRVYNLEWCDGYYNQQHRFKVLKQPGSRKGYYNNKSSKPVYQLDINTLNTIMIYKSCQEAMRALGKSTSTCIASAARGYKNGKTAYNYRWSYFYPLPE